MHFPIPFTRVQSDITPVSGERPLYCLHNRTASADSTEYWVWNGPDNSHYDGYKEFVRVSDESIRDDTMSSQEFANSSNELGGIDSNSPPRLDQIVIHDRAPPPAHEEGSFFEASLDLAADDSSSSQSDLSSFTSDLPSESLSPILRANRQMLNDSYASRLHMRDDDSPQSNLFGLGIFDLTRKDDPLHPFDGLGVVHIQSTIENGQEHDECKLSQTFLHDLEDFFLVKNIAPSSSGEAPTTRVEEAADADIHTPKEQEQPFLTQLSPISPVTATATTPKTFTSRILRPCETVEPSRTITLPRSSTTSTICSSSCTASSSFFKQTCCAFRSQYNLNTLRAEHAFPNAGSTSTSTNRTLESGSGIDEERDKRSRGVPSFRPANHDPLPSSASTRNLSAGVRMGLPRSCSHAGSSNGLRSLQTHSVRDLRDLSVLGTISSELKKRGVVVPSVSSGSDIGLAGASGTMAAPSSGSR